MKLLLDTHALLWWLGDDPALATRARDCIAEPVNLVYVSAVTAWEIVVKKSLGKLSIPDEWETVVREEAFRRLDVTWKHASEVGRLPDIHRDPFDRLLVAQAVAEGLTLVTHDRQMARYGIPLLWD